MTVQWNLSQGSDGSESITAMIDGQFYTAEKDHPNYSEIKASLANQLTASAAFIASDEEVRDLFDVSFKIGQKFESLSERVKVSGGRVFFDGVAIENSLTSQILRFVSQRLDDWKPLVRFWDKIATNPDEHSRQNLYDWLDNNDFTIADDGDIIAYKSVQDNFRSVTRGPALVNGEWTNDYVANNPGNVVELPRDQVVHDPNQTCSFGLHAATFNFAKGFHYGPIVKLKINPRDVVSVPTDAGGDKMRVCRYVVVEVVERPVESAVEWTGWNDPFSDKWVDDTHHDDDDDELDDYGEEPDDTDDTDEEDEELVGLLHEAESVFGRLKRRFGLQ